MVNPAIITLYLSVSCLLVVQHPCQAKPHHSKKSHLYYKDDGLQSPFAPPAFYDEGADYEYKDGKWMSWTPAQNNIATKHKGDPSKPIESDNNLRPETKYDDKDLRPETKYDDKDLRPEIEYDDIKEADKPVVPKFEDACKNVYCKYGRICQVDKLGKAQCICAGTDFCIHHSKRVCGTDGVLYPSHCELHRMACIKGGHIGIDHTGSQCAPVEIKQDKADDVPQIFDIKVSKQKIPDVEEDLKVKDYNAVLSDQTMEEDGPETMEDEDFSEVPEMSKVEDLEKKVKDVEDVDYGYKSVTELKTPCEEPEYQRLKDNLLQYHCARIGEMDCTADPSRKQFVANIMFNYYDLNADQKLTKEELIDIENRDHLDKLSRFCRLSDLMMFDDREDDGNISLTEFYSAFGIPTVLLEESLKVFTSLVTAGNSVELKCDITGATEIVWKRNGAMLDELITDDIQVFEDGSLYLKNIGLHHTGNYSCQDSYEDSIQQTHILKVQMPPQVKVNPSTQFHTSGASVTLRCHADGVPQPEIVWEMNESPLPLDLEGKHYVMLNKNATLEIKQATYTKDTGAYKCKAKNSAGTAQDIATVFIENSKVPAYAEGGSINEVFVVFHDKGYTVYEPNHCHLEHLVTGEFSYFKYLPDMKDTIPTLCDGEKCVWGGAVNVNNKFVYISQPELDRVVVIEITQRSNPVEIIPTDKFPVKLMYVEHLDQVWVLCWNQAEDSGAKTAVVIRQASQPIQHHTVHTQPIGNRFDLIEDFFLPPSNNLKHTFNYGYTMHHDQQGLYKLDLRAMQYVKNIDLKQYSCVPKSVAFVPMGGLVIVHCMAPAGEPEKSARLVLDYVTDKVLEYTGLGGEPYLSPDARYLVTVETDGNTISVSKLKDDGKMEHIFDEYTNLHISDVTFFPSERGHGYDFYASSTNKNDVLYIDLETGKVEMIEGVGPAISPEEWPWSHHNRVIVSGGMFGGFLMTPSKDSVVVIDGQRRAVQCEWQNIKHGNVMVWVDPMHL